MKWERFKKLAIIPFLSFALACGYGLSNKKHSSYQEEILPITKSTDNREYTATSLTISIKNNQQTFLEGEQVTLISHVTWKNDISPPESKLEYHWFCIKENGEGIKIPFLTPTITFPAKMIYHNRAFFLNLIWDHNTPGTIKSSDNEVRFSVQKKEQDQWWILFSIITATIVILVLIIIDISKRVQAHHDN